MYNNTVNYLRDLRFGLCVATYGAIIMFEHL